MNILAVNLARFGDQLQSQAAINTLAELPAPDGKKAASPNRICLISIADFASSGSFLKNVELNYPLPGDGFLQRMTEDWPNTMRRLWSWRSELWQHFKPDLVCNLTPSVSAALLGRFLAEDVPLSGFGLDEFGFAQENSWGSFLRSASKIRSNFPFNIVDVFRGVAGSSQGLTGDFALKQPGPEITRTAWSAAAKGSSRLGQPEAETVAVRHPDLQTGDSALGQSETPNPQFPPVRCQTGDSALRLSETAQGEKLREQLAEAGPGAKFIAFQLGASEARRRWPTEYFAALGLAVWKEFAYTPLLLGGKGETGLTAEYAAASAALDPSTPHLSLIGRTSLPALALALQSSELLVSNDTGTMHLAAGLGVPVLALFMATAQAWDTGPYLEDCCSLEPGLDCHPCNFIQACPHEHKCRRAITPEAVIPLCSAYLKNGHWTGGALKSLAQEQRPRAWVSRRDQYGFMDLESISGHAQEARTLWFREQRIFLRQFLDRNRAEPFQYREPEAKFVFPANSREKLSQELVLLKAQLTLLLEIGVMLQKKPLPQLTERFMAALHKASASFMSSAYLISLGQLWQAEVEERGDKLAAALLCIEQYHSLISSLLQRVKV